ncbi:hypothetical protein N3K66_004577 [Trichothecium roseum]|uniref:Uncharacterized protein n=1 Tax=Trichothecium roseum TaxID=47278 RepID=A0ACC0V1P0_9HYPO|nr:hypothetical protein N3K66_004577 [Trichothecium roseum]
MPPRPTSFPRVFSQLAATRPQCPRCGGNRSNNTPPSSSSLSSSSPRRPELLLPSRPSRHQKSFHKTPHTLYSSSSSSSGATGAGAAANLASKNHYDRLGVPPSAAPADIKRSFYRLSKAHHPDANPSDPHASDIFSLLSESYTVLSDPGLRAAYDRDVLRHHRADGRHDGDDAPRGSYHSAGGRAPSGLSRRRGTFRGPPPSFYRNGAWGAHEGARRRAHEESTGGAEYAARSGAFDGSDGGDNAYHHHYRRDRGPDPMGYHDEVPHFDKEGHERTQRREDQRRHRRGAAQSSGGGEGTRDAFDDGLGAGAQFVIVVGLLAASSLMSMAYYQVTSAAKVSPRKKKD